MMEIVKTFSDIIRAFPSRLPGSGTFKPGASEDDGYCSGTSTITKTGDLLFGNNSGTPRHNWARFPNVTIPAGATIKTAIIRFRNNSTRSSACDLKVYFNAADDPAAPANATDYHDRLLTTAYVSWSMGTTYSATDYDTPDLSVPLQEVISRAGWASGNALLAMLFDDSSADWRSIKGYDSDTDLCARLIVTYEYTP